MSDNYDLPAEDIHALDQLDYHTLKVRRYRFELDQVQQSFRAEMARMQDRLNEAERTIKNRIDWHLLPIEAYHRAHPRDRSLVLAHGTSKLRVPKTAQTWITDAAAVHEWALTHHPEITKPPGVSDVRKLTVITGDESGYVTVDVETGEVVPGMTAEMPLPTWTLDTEEGEPFL